MEQSIRVLHVDDDPDVRELAATFVMREDDRLDVVTASGPEAARERLADGEIDCVVSDYDMPGENGIEFLRTVREHDAELPFILYTGKGSEEVAGEAISAGVTDYLQKGRGTEQYAVLANRIRNAVESYRSQQALAERNRTLRRYEHMINSMHEAVCIYDADGRFEIVNDYLLGWYGTSEADLVGTKSPLVEHVRTRRDDDPFADLLAGERDEVTTEVDREFPDHGRATVAVRLTPLEIDGAIEGVVAVGRDVTEQRAREAELERTNALRSTLLETLPQGVLAEDESRDILAVNQQLFDLFEMSGDPAAVVGRDCERMAETVSEQFVDGEGFVDRTNELVDGREPVDGERFSLVDGRTLERSYRPIELSERTGHLWVYHDVSEREDLLDRLESQYETLFEEAPVMAVVTRAEGGTPVVDACNRQFAETLGYEKAAVVDTELAAFYTPESAAELLAGGGYQRSLDGAFTRERRTLETAEGETVETLLRAVPRRDGDGDVVGTLAMYIDITEREAVKRANERLEEFTRIVSHDLRNPLSVAIGRLELAREECDSEHLAAVERANERMQSLIDDLLALARQGEVVTDPEPVALSDCIADCWEHVETDGAHLVVDDGPVIYADESRLKHVFENLFRNSVEHGSTNSRPAADDSVEHGSTRSRPGDDDSVEGGSAGKWSQADDGEPRDEGVTIRIGRLPDGFYVEDDGPGIPTDAREQVFDSGYSTTREGTGFGLSIVEEVVTAHDWTIAVTDGETGGARFEITGVEFDEPRP